MGNPLHLFSPKVQAMIAQQHPNLGLKVAPAAAQAPIRQAKGDGMNKTERAYRELIVQTMPGAIIHREPSLPLCNGSLYKLDFLVVLKQPDGRWDHIGYETKGFRRSTGILKLKFAAKEYPWIAFYLVRRIDGAWEHTRVWP